MVVGVSGYPSDDARARQCQNALLFLGQCMPLPVVVSALRFKAYLTHMQMAPALAR